MTNEQIISELLNEFKEGCLGLAWIVDRAAHDTGVYEEREPGALRPITDLVEVKARTLLLVRGLLNTKRVQAGDMQYGEIEVKPWRIPVEDVVKRIDHEWAALGKEPSLDFPVGLGECTPENWPHGG